MCSLIFQSFISLGGGEGSCLLCSPQCEKNTAMAHLGFWPPGAQLITAQASIHQTRSVYKAQKAIKQCYHVLFKVKRILEFYYLSATSHPQFYRR